MGLPAGSGTDAQGAEVYAQNCVTCHGPNGAGTPSGDRLSGGIGSLATPTPIKTVNSYWPHATTVFDYIRRAMPITAPQSLSNEEVYAVTAYILSLDNVVPANATLDAQSLPRVQMPPIGTRVPDTEGLALIERWIESLDDHNLHNTEKLP